jgi:hypothetical protein
MYICCIVKTKQMNITELKSELRTNIELLRGNTLSLTVDNVTRKFNTLNNLGSAILDIEEKADKCYFFPNEDNSIIIFTRLHRANFINNF